MLLNEGELEHLPHAGGLLRWWLVRGTVNVRDECQKYPPPAINTDSKRQHRCGALRGGSPSEAHFRSVTMISYSLANSSGPVDHKLNAAQQSSSQAPIHWLHLELICLSAIPINVGRKRLVLVEIVAQALIPIVRSVIGYIEDPPRMACQIGRR